MSARTELDLKRLAKMIEHKRGSQSLREVAEQIGDVSPSTLSRIEGERVRDLNVSTFLRISDWLGVAPNEFIITAQAAAAELPITETIELQLRAAKEFDEKTALMLSKMVKAAYEAVKDG